MSAEIDDVVRRVPGVRGVYPSMPELLGASERGRTVHVRIGIDDADASRVVCERVYEAVLEHVRGAAPQLEPRIEVTVVAIG